MSCLRGLAMAVLLIIVVLIGWLLWPRPDPSGDRSGLIDPQPGAAATTPTPTVTTPMPVPRAKTKTAPLSEADLDDWPSATTAAPRPNPEAEATAGTFMRAFARPAPSQKSTWWSHVAPRLTPAARTRYHDIDPTQIPFTEVTRVGPVLASVTEAEAANDTITVTVTTDAGTYQVVLTGNLVSQVIFPPRQK